MFTDQNFEREVLGSDTPVLVDFGADWCAPCKQMTPIVKGIAEEYEGVLKVGEVDVDESPQVAMKFGIRSVPSLLIFHQGRVVYQVIGTVNRHSLVRQLHTILTP
jgi:thioredoxin 1